MARVTIEDCLEHVDNRFGLVALAAKRARELLTTNIDPLVAWENDKATVVALREIAEGLITQENVGQHAKHEKTDKELTAELSAEFQRLAEEAESSASEDPSQE